MTSGWRSQIDFRVAVEDEGDAQSLASKLDAPSLNAALARQARTPPSSCVGDALDAT